MSWARALAILCVLSACDCGDDSPQSDAGPDAGRDAGPDGGRDAGRDAAPATAPGTGLFVPSAGGQIQSPGYRMRLSVGAPQPMGTATGGSRQITVGPAAAGR